MVLKKYKQSKETRKKRSLALKGRKRHPFPEEWKKKISQSHKGKHYSPETEFKKGMVSLVKGKKMPEEKYPDYGMRNKKHSKENKKRMSIVKKGKHPSEKTKRKLSKALLGKNKGKNCSEKTRNKIRNAMDIHHINGNHNDNQLLNRMKLSHMEHIKVHIINNKLKKQGMMMSGIFTIDNPHLRGEVF